MSPRLDVANANNLVTVRVPYLLIFKRYWRPLIGTSAVWCGQCLSIIFPLINLLRFIFDFVAFSNVIFLGAIISSVIHDGDITKIVEWQLLLVSLTMPGAFRVLCALLCNPLGRRNTVRSFVEKVIFMTKQTIS